MLSDGKKALTYIRTLVDYAIDKKLAQELDRWVLSNFLMGIFDIHETPSEKAEPMDEMEAIKGLKDHAKETGHPWGDLPEEKFTGRIMGMLTPSNGSVAKQFFSVAEKEGYESASQWFYRFSSATKDVRLDLAARDLRWTVKTAYGDLQITINRSKPEKDPRDIAAPKTGETYPRCLLCPENAGFWGIPGHPERANHRIIPISLDHEEWFFQYSPYVYYHQHCIVFSREHRPMSIGPRTIPRILDFLDTFPHLFLGSNAALPIIGGSILDHDHFQGGNWTFPIQGAEARRNWRIGEVEMEALRWPLSTLRLRSEDRNGLEKAASAAISRWQRYDDGERGIKATTLVEGKEFRHNSVSVIGRKSNRSYEVDLVLRNNQTSEEFPHGRFHIHPSRHHIKKENIGLIEAMGLAVLPGRLATEMDPVIEALTGAPLSLPENSPHAPWAMELLKRNGSGHPREESRSIVEREIGMVFLEALRDCAVYPDETHGWDGLDRFAASVVESVI